MSAEAKRQLVCVRHGESEWNKLNLFTGWKDPKLTEKGQEEAKKGGEELKKRGLKFDVAYTSALTRAHETLEIIKKEIGQEDLETFKDQALNERDYGDLAGLNKDDARKKWGEEQVHIWRRSYDVPPPGGESLELTVKRVRPYFEKEILPRVIKGENVLLVAHGNSIRGLIKDLKNISDNDIVKLELDTGVPIVFELNEKGEVVKEEKLTS